VGVVTAVAVAAAVVGYRETRPDQRDRRAIRSLMADMEQVLRRHDVTMWLRVTTPHDADRSNPVHMAAHERMLRDFERLQHLPRFAMTDVEIEVAGNTARARYRIDSAPPPPGAPLPPVGGEMQFVRGPDGWEMTDHHLLE